MSQPLPIMLTIDPAILAEVIRAEVTKQLEAVRLEFARAISERQLAAEPAPMSDEAVRNIVRACLDHDEVCGSHVRDWASEVVDNALDNYDPTDNRATMRALESAIDDYDMDDKVEAYIENNADKVRRLLGDDEDENGNSEKVRQAIAEALRSAADSIG